MPGSNQKPRNKSRGIAVEWSSRHGFTPFGDRLNFLSPERQHMNTGKLTIMPPLNPEKRNGSR